MKIGSVEWLKREREWLLQDIEDNLKVLHTLRPDHPMLEEYKTDLRKQRNQLKLLRENPREYVRQAKENLS